MLTNTKNLNNMYEPQTFSHGRGLNVLLIIIVSHRNCCLRACCKAGLQQILGPICLAIFPEDRERKYEDSNASGTSQC